MNFEWKMPKDGNSTFDEKVHNLACFEIVLNIFRMKTKAGDEETSDLFNTIMGLKDKKVSKFRTTLLKDIGLPESIMDSPEIGEA
jgi:hypothetical protein